MSIKILEETNKIPIVLGVTGHLNVFKGDYSDISEVLCKDFEEILELCNAPTKKAQKTRKVTQESENNTCAKEESEEQPPLILLTGLARGADTLVANVARKYKIPYIAILPFSLEEFQKDFKTAEDLEAFKEAIAGAEDIVIVGDLEDDLANQHHTNERDYWYRQVGVYIAQHSSILFALWDGYAPTQKYSCGTTDVVDMALNHTYVKRHTGPHLGMPGDCVVRWIKCRRGEEKAKDITSNYLLPSVYRKGDDDPNLFTIPPNPEDKNINDDKATNNVADSENKNANQTENKTKKEEEIIYQCVISTEMPEITKKIIRRTVEYNEQVANIDGVDWDDRLLAKEEDKQTSNYQQRLHRHYLKANILACAQKPKFIKAVWWLAILGMLIAAAFMLYDELNWNWLSLPCGAIVVGMIFYYFYLLSPKNQYHRKFLAWRALSEALRVQFYISTCGVDYDICDSFTWMQKNDIVWIDRALAALSVGNIENKVIDLDKVKERWIGTGKLDSRLGQYAYHARKSGVHGSLAQKHSKWSTALLITTIALYAIIFVAELLTLTGAIDWLEVGVIWSEFTVRKLLQVLFGVLTVVSFLITASFGKLSYERQSSDNTRMKLLYFTALSKLDPASPHFDQLVIALAREEIVENGVWLSYMLDNSLEITV